MIALIVNGEAKEMPVSTVAELMAALSLSPTLVAVELNRAIVPRSAHETQALNEGDQVEIVRFIGGG